MLKKIKQLVADKNLSADDISKAVNCLSVIDSDGQEDNIVPNFWTQLQELYEWWEEIEEKKVPSIIVDAWEGNFFYNPDEIAVIEAPINRLKDGE